MCAELGSVELLTSLAKRLASDAPLAVCRALRSLCFEENARGTIGKNELLTLVLQ